MQINEFRDISYELDADGIVTISLNTPKRKNALSGLTALELRWAAKHFQEDDNAQAMILTGSPDPDSAPERQAFSSGGYFVPGIYDDLPAHIVEQIDMSDIAMKATVTVMLKDGVLDPQGQAVASALGSLGFSGVGDVRQGKVIELDIDGTKIALQHYPEIGRRLAESGAYDAVFTGHDHQRYQHQIGDHTLWANPGEIMGRFGHVTYGLFDTVTKTFEHVEISSLG